MFLAVNISAHQFMMPHFVKSIEILVCKYNINPSRLKLELTESVVLNDINDIVAKMDELRTLGVRLSLDDFGTVILV